MPLTMLSGVFYSIHSLPPFWQQVSHLNPFFYLIDGLRYGFFGVSDVSPFISLTVSTTFFLAASAGTLLQVEILNSNTAPFVWRKREVRITIFIYMIVRDVTIIKAKGKIMRMDE